MLKKMSYLLVLLTVSAVVSSCASGAKKGETVFLTDYGKYTDNYLVYKQTRLALPDGWSFLPRKDKDSKIIVFKIDDNQNNVVGDFAYWRPKRSPSFPLKKSLTFTLMSSKMKLKTSLYTRPGLMVKSLISFHVQLKSGGMTVLLH